jgi:hypothetical protein
LKLGRNLIRFDYSVFRDNKAPVIPVEFRGRDRWHNLWVYVDSGASLSILHMYEARRLGVEPAGVPKVLYCGGGRPQNSGVREESKNAVGAAGGDGGGGFLQALGGAFNLLGRKGVFDKFASFRWRFNDDRRETLTFSIEEG